MFPEYSQELCRVKCSLLPSKATVIDICCKRGRVCVCVCVYVYLCSVMSDSLQPQALCPWDSLGKNTAVSCHALWRGTFPNQGWNPGLALQVDSLPSEPPGKPKNTGVGSLSLYTHIHTHTHTVCLCVDTYVST